MHGHTPWTGKSEFELVKNIENKDFKMREDLKAETKDFLRKCLQRQEKDRISWDEYFVHPIFNGFFDNYAAQNKEFKNKLKTVMSELRLKVNSHYLGLTKILYDMGFEDLNK